MCEDCNNEIEKLNKEIAKLKNALYKVYYVHHENSCDTYGCCCDFETRINEIVENVLTSQERKYRGKDKQNVS